MLTHRFSSSPASFGLVLPDDVVQAHVHLTRSLLDDQNHFGKLQTIWKEYTRSCPPGTPEWSLPRNLSSFFSNSDRRPVITPLSLLQLISLGRFISSSPRTLVTSPRQVTSLAPLLQFTSSSSLHLMLSALHSSLSPLLASLFFSSIRRQGTLSMLGFSRADSETDLTLYRNSASEKKRTFCVYFMSSTSY